MTSKGIITVAGTTTADDNNNSGNNDHHHIVQQNSTTAATDNEHGKQHTFRKRRLSLPMHHLSAEAAAATATTTTTEEKKTDNEHQQNGNSLNISKDELEELRKLEYEDDNNNNNKNNNNANAAPSPVSHNFNHSNNTAEEEKAHTFRKRRLSLTTKTAEEQQSNNINKRNRRTSMDSVASSVCSAADYHNTRRFVSRTLHSGELITSNVAPPSPAVDSLLYQVTPLPPPLLQLHNDETPDGTTNDLHHHHQQQSNNSNDNNDQNNSNNVPYHHTPRWKRRRTLNPLTEEHKLPFSQDIVGTYSCHGVEPVYGSDYEEEDDDDEVEEEIVEQQQIIENVAAATETVGTVTVQDGNNEITKLENGNGNGNAAVPLHIMPPPPPSEQFDQQQQNQIEEQPGEDNLNNTEQNDDDVVAAAVEVAVATTEEQEQQVETPPVTVAKINQDRGGVAFPYGNCPKTALFAVYDGHGQGGELVSQFALHEIQRRLEKHKLFRSNIEIAFKETFIAVDEALRHEPIIEPLFAGTTACVALLRDKILTIANAGDSRCVCARRLSNGNYIALELTEDQNPDVPEEMERILNSGGYVSLPPAPGLSARVWLDASCTQIGLAMARSIGDHAVSQVGVIAEPVVTTHEITNDDEFLILASDGVWEFINSIEAVNVVGSNLYRGSTKACQALIEAAAARWHEEEGAYRDDITAIVVKLQDLWKGANISTIRKESICNSETSVTTTTTEQ